jgi:hypothetical protein
VERPERRAPVPLEVPGGRLGRGPVGEQRHERPQPAVQRLDPRQGGPDQLGAAGGALPDQARLLDQPGRLPRPRRGRRRLGARRWLRGGRRRRPRPAWRERQAGERRVGRAEVGGGGQRGHALQVQGEVALHPVGVGVGHLQPGGGQPRPQRGGQIGPLPVVHADDATLPAGGSVRA